MWHVNEYKYTCEIEIEWGKWLCPSSGGQVIEAFTNRLLQNIQELEDLRDGTRNPLLGFGISVK